MKKIVFVVEDTEALQYRYRVKNVLEALRGNNEWQAGSYLKSELPSIDFGDIDIIIVLRQAAKDGVVLRLIRRAQADDIRVLYDLDDLVFNYLDLGLVLESVQEKNWLYWMGYIWGVRRIAKRVDGFICTNDFLARKLERSFKKPVRAIRNSLNREQIEISDKLIKEKMAWNKKVASFLIGYFSGSPTHKKDFELVEPELVRFLTKYEDAKLRVVGYMDFSKRMRGMIDAGRVEVMKPVDYLELQRLMAEVDVNIAPLVINDFTNCKSELKFFEAAAVETTTIASPTYAFKKAIKDGENGFLAKPGEWYDKLENLYRNPGENRKIAKRAHRYVLKHYYGEEFLKEIEEAYDYFAS